MTINEFLVKKIAISGKAALAYIQDKKIFINDHIAVQQQQISDQDKVVWNNKILQSPTPLFYLAYYKPRGIECTMNKSIKNNLCDALPEWKDFFPIGRLDKESEGLLILTNDGQLYKNIAPSEALKEKEYLVKVDRTITDENLRTLSEGVTIMGKITRPCEVTRQDDFTFRIVLTQGLNRQIRRMCYKLGLNVTSLVRIRIMSLLLGSMKPGEFKKITKEEILIITLEENNFPPRD